MRRLREAPLLVVALGALLVAAVAASVGVRIESIALDETLHKQQALTYADHVRLLFSDAAARSTARLYSFVLAPLFAAFDGDSAVRAARALSALLFASAAIPAYLLARTVLVSRWLAAAAALLSVVAPWLVLTTVLFTENLAFPLFLWTVWAVVRAMATPSWRWDLLALALVAACVATRTQLFALGVGYVALVAWRAWSLRRETLRRYPFTCALVAVVVLAGLVLLVTGELSDRVTRALGPYGGINERGTAPTDVGLAALYELMVLGLGVGVVPMAVALVWVPRNAARLPVLVGLVLAGVLWAATLYAQGGFLGLASEERYFFYVVPLVWIAALAAAEDRTFGLRSVLVGGAVMAVLLATIGTSVGSDPERIFLAPAAASVGRLLFDLLSEARGVSPRDVLALLALALTVGAALVWRRRPVAGLLVVPVVVQLALTWYVLFGFTDGAVHAEAKRTGTAIAANGWIDHAADGRQATLVVNQPPPAAATQRALSFYNDAIRDSLYVGSAGLPQVAWPTIHLGVAEGTVQPDGALSPPRAPRPLSVQAPESPHLQVDGRRIALAPDGTSELVETPAAWRVRWAASGLAPDGSLPPGARVGVLSGRDGATAVTLRFAPAPPGTAVRLRLGDVRRTVRGGAAREVRVRVCGPAEGTLTARAPGARLEAVRVAPAARPIC